MPNTFNLLIQLISPGKKHKNQCNRRGNQSDNHVLIKRKIRLKNKTDSQKIRESEGIDYQ